MLVETLMTSNVLCVAPDASLSEAIRMMLDHKISGLPVVDQSGELVGLISEGDLLRRIELGTQDNPSSWSRLFRPGSLAKSYALTHGRRVEELMSRACVTVEKKTKLADAVALMQYHAIRRLPVVEGNRVIGILSRTDIVRALSEKLEPTGQEADLSDSEIAHRINEDLQQEDWAPRSEIEVLVEDGHVELRGTIIDDKQRVVARILAENVIGVKSVTDNLIWGDPLAAVAF